MLDKWSLCAHFHSALCVCVWGGGTFAFYICKGFADFFRFKTLNFDIYIFDIVFLGVGVGVVTL